MPARKRFKTKYPGVYFIEGKGVNGKTERIFYVMYRKNGKLIEEKAGRQYKDDMTAARASQLRTRRIEGDQLSNHERREVEKQSNEIWNINKLWTEYVKQKSIKGIAQDRSRFENYIKPFLGDKEPHLISHMEIDRFRLRVLKDKSPQSIKNTLELLRRLVNFGLKRKLCQPLTFILEMPKNINNQRTEDLSDDQLVRLLEVLNSDNDIQISNLMKMALFTGMRKGELFRLKWEDIDFQRMVINIRNPKGGQDQTIPLNDVAADILKNHPQICPYVFPGHGGGQRVEARRGVNRIKKIAELPEDFRPLHGLRHSFASLLASSGEVDLYTLQKLLTHKSSVMTQRYAHLRDDALKKASNLAGNIINKVVLDKKVGEAV